MLALSLSIFGAAYVVVLACAIRLLPEAKQEPAVARHFRVLVPLIAGAALLGLASELS
jgi:hypothetical protein